MRAPVSDTRHLALLVALDDEGSLNAAARRLHLTPSALSQQLRELEERLGGPLFHRAWRRLSPTPAGRHFTDRARGILEELGRVESETRRLATGANGTIRVATACMQSYRWLPGVLALFAESHPNIEVTVVPEAADAPSEWLVDRKLDVALVGPGHADRRVSVTRLFRDELIAVVGREHKWFGKSRVAPALFAHEHVWADDGAFERESPLGRALAEAGNVTPRKITRVPMTGTVAIDMARANLGITVMPKWVVEPLLAAREFGAVRIGKGLWLDWSIATRKEKPDAALSAFVAALRKHHPHAAR